MPMPIKIKHNVLNTICVQPRKGFGVFCVELRCLVIMRAWDAEKIVCWHPATIYKIRFCTKNEKYWHNFNQTADKQILCSICLPFSWSLKWVFIHPSVLRIFLSFFLAENSQLTSSRLKMIPFVDYSCIFRQHSH